MIRLYFTILCSFAAALLLAQPHLPVDSLHDGDLLFVVNGGGNAITDVTHGVEGYPVDHVAIFHWIGTEPVVIQAVPGHGVEMVSIDSLCSLMAGRVCAAGFDARESIVQAQRHIGKPYDNYFDASDQAMYCSELVQKSFVTRRGKRVFKTIPMEFRDASGAIPQFWVDHYRQAGRQVPEGKPGTNPGALSRSPQVVILGQLDF